MTKNLVAKIQAIKIACTELDLLNERAGVQICLDQLAEGNRLTANRMRFLNHMWARTRIHRKKQFTTLEPPEL